MIAGFLYASLKRKSLSITSPIKINRSHVSQLNRVSSVYKRSHDSTGRARDRANVHEEALD